MSLDPDTKLAQVRKAMADDDWERAIRLTAKLRSLGKYQKAIDRANDFLNHPALYEQMGYDRDKTIEGAVAALKEKFSQSWEAVAGENKRRTRARQAPADDTPPRRK
ncbi:hypothetical protein X760_05885 [Mesorhizobium sp. LSHC422A00]|uniref:hypothetical protein n=1 Tax=Mesorhizobium sp. LSHC422A00 TaxID=1287294 RepID=UPI0003CE4C23|nr:hypothetical protein [Mesorhizobium sp. LSHC422A00]ESX62653.1 hypothetical protein X760_05885 [Mesorhizobium sp. LSHC422A00]